jgi:hypothetical protein
MKNHKSVNGMEGMQEGACWVLVRYKWLIGIVVALFVASGLVYRKMSVELWEAKCNIYLGRVSGEYIEPIDKLLMRITSQQFRVSVLEGSDFDPSSPAAVLYQKTLKVNILSNGIQLLVHGYSPLDAESMMKLIVRRLLLEQENMEAAKIAGLKSRSQMLEEQIFAIDMDLDFLKSTYSIQMKNNNFNISKLIYQREFSPFGQLARELRKEQNELRKNKLTIEHELGPERTFKTATGKIITSNNPINPGYLHWAVLAGFLGLISVIILSFCLNLVRSLNLK